MKEFFLSSLWMGILIGFLLGTGIWWSFNPRKTESEECEDEIEYSKKIDDLQKQINDLNNKIAHLDGRFLAFRENMLEGKK